MSWTLIFLIAGVILLLVWAYKFAKDFEEHSRVQPKIPVPVSFNDELGNIGRVRVPDVFDEERIASDLARLASSPGALGKYIAQAQIRFTQARQIAVLESWTDFYNAGKEVLRARTELARAHDDLQQVGIESEVKLKEKDAKLADYDAQIAESELRAAQARHKSRNLGGERENELTPEQKRMLKKAEIESRILRLKHEKAIALAAIDPQNEDSRMRTENLYDDRIAHEEEQLAKYL